MRTLYLVLSRKVIFWAPKNYEVQNARLHEPLGFGPHCLPASSSDSLSPSPQLLNTNNSPVIFSGGIVFKTLVKSSLSQFPSLFNVGFAFHNLKKIRQWRCLILSVMKMKREKVYIIFVCMSILDLVIG